jgi:hypothetical protein
MHDNLNKVKSNAQQAAVGISILVANRPLIFEFPWFQDKAAQQQKLEEADLKDAQTAVTAANAALAAATAALNDANAALQAANEGVRHTLFLVLHILTFSPSRSKQLTHRTLLQFVDVFVIYLGKMLTIFFFTFLPR